MSITKIELIQSLVENIHISKQDAKILVDNFFDIMSSALEKGEEVKISGFGSFNMRDKKSRPGRNLHTGEAVTISERRVVTFKQGAHLKRLAEEELA